MLVLLLFTAGSFVAAGLLFLVQPMVAKMLLPVLGGTPAVWNLAMVFFQAMLLAGYAYAHITTRVLGPRRQVFLHVPLLLLPLIVLPFSGPTTTPVPVLGSFELAVLGAFGAMVGVPFFVVASASPLFQRWFAATGHAAGGDPYFLYAAGNAGSLLALFAYPFMVERVLPAPTQARLWTIGYIVYVVLALACIATLCLRRTKRAEQAWVDASIDAAAPSWRLRLRWLGYAFVPASLLLGVTSYLSTDIAAVPLLWVVPLGVYLLTYIVAFMGRTPLRLVGRAVPALVVMVLLGLWLRLDGPALPIIALHLLTLLAVGLLAHGRLVATRPHPSRLTEFYFLLSLGGVLGGMFNALLAPALFNSLVEYPLVLVIALLLVPAAVPTSKVFFGRMSPRIVPPVVGCIAVLGGVLALIARFDLGMNSRALVVLAAGTLAGACFVFALRVPRFGLASILLALTVVWATLGTALFAQRTFFGVHRVVDAGDHHLLLHGTTVHGTESLAPDLVGEPVSYYSRGGPFGDITAATTAGRHEARVAIVGLGTGALAAYGEPDQRYDFYEIDPVVVRVAQDPALFTYLSSAKADISVLLGDGRLRLAGAPDGYYDLIVLDAFSSDSIPVHLLTREAVQLYHDKLVFGGVLAFHISNRYLDLEPVLAAVGDALDLAGLIAFHEPLETDGDQVTSSLWLVLSEPGNLGDFEQGARWQPVRSDPRVPAWTDDYSDIVSILRRW